MPNSEPLLLLIDGPAHFYRAFYAIRALTDPKGRPVNAVYGFAQMLLNLRERYRPEYGVVAFDRPEATHRHELYPEYKAHRDSMPEELQAQVPLVKDMVKAFGFALAEQPGQEADDLIGTLALRARSERMQVMIFTTDKDAFQLVRPGVTVARPIRGGKGENEELDAAGVERVFGVPPDQVTDVLALMGDASDNVPGVPGVGEKTAKDLIKTYGSVEAVYARLDRITQTRLREKLAANRPLAELSKTLVTLNTQAPLAHPWEHCRLPESLSDEAYALLNEFGFKSLLLRQKREVETAAAWTEGLSAQADPAEVVRVARATGRIAVETLEDGVALAAQPREAALIPWLEGGLTATVAAGGAWVDALCDPAVTKVGYDLKPLAVALLRCGRSLRGPLEDLHLMAHLLDLPANRREDFAARVLGGAPEPERKALLACASLLTAGSLRNRVRAQNGDRVLDDVETPLLPVLAQMEATGVAIDGQALQDMSVRLGLQIGNLEREIQRQAGVEFNVRSTQQLAEVLFDRLRLESPKRTKTGRSTSVEVLESLAAQHPLPGLILEYRQLQKLKSTYLDVLPGLVDPRDGRLHTTFHQVGAATGRLSSSDPNLQNIPIRTELGRELRRAFVPVQAGDCLLSADYSQIELRLLAHLSGDARMLADFRAGADIHAAAATEIFHVPLDQVTPEMRRQAKVCNFGIAYGVSPYGLARQLGISQSRGKEFIDRFFDRYPQIREYLDGTIAFAREHGYVQTLLGRRRPAPDVASANRMIREAGERMAINAPIQGSSADIIKLAMIKLARELESRNLRSRMILQVHDELVFEGPEEEMPELKTLVVEIMSGVYPLQVQLPVEANWGKNWMAAHG